MRALTQAVVQVRHLPLCLNLHLLHAYQLPRQNCALLTVTGYCSQQSDTH